jgi:hypothetical protein
MRRDHSLPFDMRRVVLAAVATALEEDERQSKQRKGLSTGRALAVGAGLFAAGKLVAGPSARRLRDAAECRWVDLKNRVDGDGQASEQRRGT